MNVTLTRELFKLCVLGLLFVSKTTHIVRKDAEPLISAHGDLCFKNLFKALCNSSRSKSASESSDFCLLLALLSCSSASDSSTPVFGTSGGTTNLTFFCLFVLVDFANELSTASWRALSSLVLSLPLRATALVVFATFSFSLPLLLSCRSAR